MEYFCAVVPAAVLALFCGCWLVGESCLLLLACGCGSRARCLGVWDNAPSAGMGRRQSSPVQQCATFSGSGVGAAWERRGSGVGVPSRQGVRHITLARASPVVP